MEENKEKPQTLRERFLNSQLVIIALFIYGIFFLDNLGFWYRTLAIYVAIFLIYIYVDDAILKYIPSVQERKKKFENNVEALVNSGFKLSGMLIFYVIIFAIIGGLAFLFFGFLGTLSVTTLLIIIIILLLFK